MSHFQERAEEAKQLNRDLVFHFKTLALCFFPVTFYVSINILSVYIIPGGFSSFLHHRFCQVRQLLRQCYGGREAGELGPLGYSRTRRL